MKQKILGALVLLLTAGLILAGCGKEEEKQDERIELIIKPIQTPAASGEETGGEDTLPVPGEFSVITEREIKDGKMQSFLTGEWKDAEVANRRPIAVMIPNNAPAMPQYGLSRAGVIYEAPVEGRITRLMCIFEDFDDLERIGPIRSSRDYFLYYALGYEAIYCNWGLARPYVEELINRDSVQNISAGVVGIYHPADEAYGRVKRPGYATEFTGYLFIDGLKKAADRLGYTWEFDQEHEPPFLFVEEGFRAEEKYEALESAVRIYPGGTEGNKSGYGSYNPYFEYHEEDGLYYRFQDGKEQIDEIDSSQLAVSNVVFQYCHGEVRDDHDYLAFGVHGDGDAIVFTGGKVIKGKWERYNGDNTPPRFLDENGEEVVFNQGKTWICNIWQEYGEYVKYE